jgi:nitroreductase
MNESFSILSKIITGRRSIKPAKMNGKKIPDEQVKALLELGNWAPTHGRTEPWRFVVHSGEGVQEFCHQHAELYRSVTPSAKFDDQSYSKIFHNGDLASHLVVVSMHRGNLPKIPALEEIAATAMSIQNILLGATAAGIASFLSTGGITHHEAMKNFLRLRREDVVMGILYLGYSDEVLQGKRQASIDEKVNWK